MKIINVVPQSNRYFIPVCPQSGRPGRACIFIKAPGADLLFQAVEQDRLYGAQFRLDPYRFACVKGLEKKISIYTPFSGEILESDCIAADGDGSAGFQVSQG